MGVIRLDKRSQFTVICQESIRDKRLSLKARGLHVYLLSYPDNWEFNIKHIIASLPDGRTSVQSALSELVTLGYATMNRPRNPDGTVAGTTYTIHEEPRNRKPDSRSFGSGKPPRNRETDNRALGDIPNTEEEPNTNSLTSFESDPPDSRRARSLKDFELDDADLTWAAEKCPNVDPQLVLDRLRNYCASKGKGYKDYRATWRNWCLDDEAKEAKRNGKPTKHDLKAIDVETEIRKADAILRRSQG